MWRLGERHNSKGGTSGKESVVKNRANKFEREKRSYEDRDIKQVKSKTKEKRERVNDEILSELGKEGGRNETAKNRRNITFIEEK
jgi:hypothetical protein